jgi:hypothetical protein
VTVGELGEATAGGHGTVRGWHHAVALSSGVLLWLSHLLLQAVLVGTVCTAGVGWLLHLVLVVHLVPTAAVTWLAVWIVRRAGAGDVGEADRFLGRTALVLDAASLALIIVEWLPTVAVPPCAFA